MVMPMATGKNSNGKSKLVSRVGAKNSSTGDIKKLIEVIAYGNNNSSNDANCTHR